MYAYNKITGEITDKEDGQHVATLADGATHEQGMWIVSAMNSVKQCECKLKAENKKMFKKIVSLQKKIQELKEMSFA